MAATHRPTPTKLRMRIAELRIHQSRIAKKLDFSEGHLSHILSGRVAADELMLARVAQAIEDVAEETAA